VSLHPSSTIRKFIHSSSLDPAIDAGDLDLLVGLLERTRSPGNVVTVGAALLGAFGGLAGVASADEAALRHSGLASAAIIDLRRVRALAVAMARSEACRRPVLSSWTALMTYLRSSLAHAPREQFLTLYLDKRNILMREEHRAEGTTDHAPVYVREVVRKALELSASAMILVHNHPSGDPTPSRADIDMTRRIIDAARVFDIQVHDHVIVGQEGTTSFRALGLM
jgi:DNA repair protein RadC